MFLSTLEEFYVSLVKHSTSASYKVKTMLSVLLLSGLSNTAHGVLRCNKLCPQWKGPSSSRRERPLRLQYDEMHRAKIVPSFHYIPLAAKMGYNLSLPLLRDTMGQGEIFRSEYRLSRDEKKRDKNLE